MKSTWFCLAVCLGSAAALSAFPAAAQLSGDSKPARRTTVTRQSKTASSGRAAFAKIIQEENAAGVEKALKANPALANTPLTFGSMGAGVQTHLPLSLTAFEGNTQIAALLIRAGAKVNAASQDGQTALDEAAYFSHMKMAAFLLAHNANIAHKNGTGQTALHQAVAGDDPATVALLLDHGADANAHDNNGATPLGLALGLHCRVSVVALLRRHGAKE